MASLTVPLQAPLELECSCEVASARRAQLEGLRHEREQAAVEAEGMLVGVPLGSAWEWSAAATARVLGRCQLLVERVV